MNWLFLFFVFDISQGQARPKLIMSSAYATEASCNALGEAVVKRRGPLPEGMASMSICISREEFAKKGMQTIYSDAE